MVLGCYRTELLPKRPRLVWHNLIVSLAGLLACELGYARSLLQHSDWLDSDRLSNREVQVHSVQAGKFSGRVLAAIQIDASPEAVWAVMTDCISAPNFVSWVVECELLESHDNGQVEIFRQQIKLAWYMPRLEHTFQLVYYPFEQIDFRRLAGSPRRFEGSWWFQPRRDATLVIYSVDLVPGFLVPGGLARRALRNELPSTLMALRERVETH